MISITEQDAKTLVQFLARVQLQGTEAGVFVGAVGRLEEQLHPMQAAPTIPEIEIKDE